ncbi:MAG: endonuclease [Flavobacteriales bacterium]|nr:endonuclease [Flavobacteriales bacterium]
MSKLRSLLIFCSWSSACTIIAQPPTGYYDSAQGLNGPALRTALYNIIDGQWVASNAGLWTYFQQTDDRPDGYVWDLYSDVPGGTAPYVFQFVSDQCGTYNGEGDCYNREHTFPKSWFNDAPPMDTDLHHVYPTDAWVNQQHGNLPYGEVGSADWTSQNGTSVGDNTFPGYSGTVCEPIDAFKGDLARTYFYMMTRYLPNISGWSSPMLQGNDLSSWAENMLLEWHLNDPVSTKEIERNNAVFAIQNNRNPFIDQPNWVINIWGPTAGMSEPPFPSNWTVTSTEAGLELTRSVPSSAHVRVHDGLGRTYWQRDWNSARLTVPMEDHHGLLLVEVLGADGRTARRVLR